MLSEKLKRRIRAYKRGKLIDKQIEKLLRDLRIEIKQEINKECRVLFQDSSGYREVIDQLVLCSRSTFEELVDANDICLLIENRGAKPKIPTLLVKLLA